MPITITPQFTTSDGAQFVQLEEAKVHEIKILLEKSDDPKIEPGSYAAVSRWAYENAVKIAAIIADNPSEAKRKRRSDLNGKHKRKAAENAALQDMKQ